MSEEWQVDERGRRFRRIGACIEYEPDVVSTFGSFPKSVYDRIEKPDAGQLCSNTGATTNAVHSVSWPFALMSVPDTQKTDAALSPARPRLPGKGARFVTHITH